jgi:predicted metal-dependent peptidase
MWKTCEPDFDLSRHLIAFMQTTPFYAEMSRHITKRQSRELPTAAVTFDPTTDDLCMYVNPDFMHKQRNAQIQGLIQHELDHLVFGHLNVRIRKPASWWNIATDLAINSLIVTHARAPRDQESAVGWSPLPDGGLIPGKRPKVEKELFDKLSPERQKAHAELADLIEKLPTLKSSEFYFHKLCENSKQKKYDEDDVVYIVSMDDHNGWDEVPSEMEEYIEGRVKAIIEKAVRLADSHADGWGNIPADIREEIRRSVSTIIDWRQVLRQFVGSLVRGNRTTSIKRINRRYPYIHPGAKRSYTAKLAVAIDQSGSVGDEMLNMFFGELDTLTRKVDVTIIPFDCGACHESDVFEWRKGTRPDLKRVKMGGTDFNAPTNFINDPKNRGRWDGLLIMTDGGAGQPGPSRIKRGWVLGQGCDIPWATDEIKIMLSKEKPMSGAWR